MGTINLGMNMLKRMSKKKRRVKDCLLDKAKEIIIGRDWRRILDGLNAA